MKQNERLFRGKPSLTLTGFMFSGKSSVGRELARQLELEFVDQARQILGAISTGIKPSHDAAH